MSSLTYLYAIASNAEVLDAALSALRGVDDQALSTILSEQLQAIVSPVSSAEWSGEKLNERVQDMAWLAPRATRHQEVLAALQQAGVDVLPLPFATLYHHPEAVAELLAREQERLRAALNRLAGHEEWTFKAYQQPAVFDGCVEQLSPAFAQTMQQSRAASPGRAYLLRKQLDVQRREAAAEITARQISEIEERVASLVRTAGREPITAAAKHAGERAKLVLKLALLMPRVERDTIQARIAKIVEEYTRFGYRFELTGPWPPYSFVHPSADGE